ncbi:MAG: hypothetical protein QOH79_1808 [Acidimicrobiaceae bacterium]
MRSATSFGLRSGHFAVAIVVAIAVAVAASTAPIVIAFTVPLVASVLVLAAMVRAFRVSIADPERERWLLTIVMAVFAVRVLVSLIIAALPAVRDTFGPDAVTYHHGAINILHHWDAGAPITGAPIAAGKEGFFYLLAGLYYVFGTYQVSGLIVNAALSAALLPVIHDTTRRLFGPAAAKAAVVMVAVLPCFLVWTSQLLREAPVIFLLAAAANAATRLTQRTTPGAYLLLGGSLTLLFTLRANVALVAAAGFVLGIAFGRSHLLPGVATGAATLGFVVVIVVAAGVGYAGFQAATGADLEQVSAARKDLSTGVSSGYAPTQDVSTTQKAITFLPIALPSFALGPFPWQARNATQIGGVLEAMSLWFLLPSLVRGLRWAKLVALRRWQALALPALLLATSLSLLIGNFGAVVRERLQATVLLVPIAAYGWTLRRTRSRYSAGHTPPEVTELARV